MDVAMLRKSANAAPERTQEGRIVNLGQHCAEDGQLVAPLLENTQVGLIHACPSQTLHISL